MRFSVAAFVLVLGIVGCASDPDYQLAKRLRQPILTAEQIGKIPPDKKFEESQAQYAARSAEPTPEDWRVGARWRFEIDPLDGRSPAFAVFRVSDIPETSTCQGDTWKKLEVVHAEGISPRSPAYSVHGRNLHVLLSTGLCDAYDEIVGELHSQGFNGWRSSSGMFGSSRTGRVSARSLESGKGR